MLSAFIILHRAYLVYLIAALGGSQKPGALDGLGMSLMFLDPVAALPIILIGAVTGIADMPIGAFYRHYYQPASIGLDCFLIYLLWLWARGAFRGREEEKKEEKNMGDSGGI